MSPSFVGKTRVERGDENALTSNMVSRYNVTRCGRDR